MDSNDRSFTILVVEEDSSFRNSLEDWLTRERYSVLTVVDKKEVIKQSEESKPDLIVMDLKLSDNQEIEIFIELRTNGSWGSQVPVIVLTANTADDANLLHQIIRCNPAYFLYKDLISLEELSEKIRLVLNRKKGYVLETM